jgi:hypothetical protein
MHFIPITKIKLLIVFKFYAEGRVKHQDKMQSFLC